MVAKISTGGNMFGALAYNQNKVDSEEAKVLFSNRMLLSEDGNFSIGECMRSFEMQMPVQLSTKKPILHISINPHPEDVLTDQQLSDIAREYMQKLGYGDQPYLVYKHEDIDRHHIHIVGLRVDENGRPLNDRFEHRRSKQITRELEKKYGLHCGTMHRWEKAFVLSEKDLSLSDELLIRLSKMRQKKSPKPEKACPPSREQEMQAEILRLRQALEYSELRNEALNEVLKIGREEYGVDLLKKAGAKQ